MLSTVTTDLLITPNDFTDGDIVQFDNGLYLLWDMDAHTATTPDVQVELRELDSKTGRFGGVRLEVLKMSDWFHVKRVRLARS